MSARLDPSRLRAIARKEVIQLRRDRRSLGLALVLPLLLLLLFGYAISTDVRNISTAVLDHDRTAESRALVAAFARSGYFAIERDLERDGEVEPLLARGTVRLALVIPRGFAAALAASKPAPIELVLDGTDAKTGTVAISYADAIARSVAGRVVPVRRDLAPAAVADVRVWYNESLDSPTMIIPGLIAVIMSMIAAMLTSLTVAREWERGTMEQLAATPVTRAEVILGKLLPYLAVGLFDVVVAVVVGVWVFDVPFRGDVLAFLGATTVFLLGALGLGIMLSSKLKSQLLATQAAMMATYMPALVLSGFMFALSNMPAALQVISLVIPARYYVAISRGVFLKGVGVEVLWLPVLGLTVYMAVVLTIAMRSFKKEIGP
jgi:ABC-2 type transport system permease protein